MLLGTPIRIPTGLRYEARASLSREVAMLIAGSSSMFYPSSFPVFRAPFPPLVHLPQPPPTKPPSTRRKLRSTPLRSFVPLHSCSLLSNPFLPSDSDLPRTRLVSSLCSDPPPMFVRQVHNSRHLAPSGENWGSGRSGEEERRDEEGGGEVSRIACCESTTLERKEWVERRIKRRGTDTIYIGGFGGGLGL